MVAQTQLRFLPTGRFAPGVSGNPADRPKAICDVVVAREPTPSRLLFVI
jgi:hypothetical protein